MESYIVRVYRNDREHDQVQGLVMDPVSGQQTAFHSPSQLWQAITGAADLSAPGVVGKTTRPGDSCKSDPLPDR